MRQRFAGRRRPHAATAALEQLDLAEGFYIAQAFAGRRKRKSDIRRTVGTSTLAIIPALAGMWAGHKKAHQRPGLPALVPGLPFPARRGNAHQTVAIRACREAPKTAVQ
jgi:hypothetical protein